MATVQLSFGLFASNKYPIVCNVNDVETKVGLVAKHGTYIDTTTSVQDTYEVLAGVEKMRAFIDLDIKRFSDKSCIPRFDGVVLGEHIRCALESIVPTLESRHGRIAVGNSCGNKARGEYCVSFRVWFPCVVGSRKCIQHFVQSLYDEFLPTFQTCAGVYSERIDWSAFLDLSVYKNMGKLRLPGCTKQGEHHRPLQIDYELSSAGVDYRDCLVTFWDPTEVTVLEDIVDAVEAPGGIQRTQDVLDLTMGVDDGVFDLITALASIPVVEWDRNASRFQLIAALWAADPSERMRTYIHAQAAAKNTNNQPEAIEGQISRITHRGVSCKTILKMAWDTDKERVGECKRRFESAWEKLFGTSVSTEDIGELIDSIVSLEPREGPAAFWTVCEYSERYVRSYPHKDWDTILLQSQMGTGKTIQLFDVIREYKRIIVLSSRRSYSNFIQSELLSFDLGFTNYMNVRGHLSGYRKLILQVESLHRIVWEYEPYDLVVLDESESLLFQMNSVGTHGAHHKENYEMLERVVRDAGKVIAMDAFVNMRSFQFLDHLRSRDLCLFIHNTFQPYDRKATELCVVNGNCVLPDFAGLVQKCQEFAAAGKRIVFVCTSKTKGEGLFDLLRGGGYTVLFHSSEDSKEEKEILLNVRSEWAKYQIVIYTTTITVGVSYSDVPVESEFDELFLYATASCALPRDIAQALLRARVIKSNRLWFCIEERCVKPTHVGLKAIEENVNQRKEMFLGTRADWEATPAWVTRLIAQNENEIAVSRKHFSLVVKRYLRMSGYTLEMPQAAEELLEMEMESEVKPYFDEIREVADEEAEVLEQQIIQGDASKDDKVVLLKHRVLRRFVEGEEGVEAARVAWNTFFVTEEGKTRSRESLFWNIVHEVQRDVKKALAAEAVSRYVEQAKMSLLKQMCVQEICGILGIAHSCEEKSWSQEAFSELAGKILKDEEKYRKTMGLRPYRGKKKESDILRASSIISQVFESWSGSKISNIIKKVQENKIKTKIHTFHNTIPIQNVIKFMK